MTHEIIFDRCGTGSFARFTCYSKDCEVKVGDTLIRHRYLDGEPEKWERLKDEYFTKHAPSTCKTHRVDGPVRDVNYRKVQ